MLCMTCKRRRVLSAMSTDISCRRCIDSVAAENRETMDERVTGKARRLYLKRLAHIGLTDEAFQSMKAEQRGLCAICERMPLGPWGLVIDHNHATGEVRGLLCSACNTALGLFHDDPDRLVTASRYLRERGHYAHLRQVVNGVPASPRRDLR